MANMFKGSVSTDYVQTPELRSRIVLARDYHEIHLRNEAREYLALIRNRMARQQAHRNMTVHCHQCFYFILQSTGYRIKRAFQKVLEPELEESTLSHLDLNSIEKLKENVRREARRNYHSLDSQLPDPMHVPQPINRSGSQGKGGKDMSPLWKMLKNRIIQGLNMSTGVD